LQFARGRQNTAISPISSSSSWTRWGALVKYEVWVYYFKLFMNMEWFLYFLSH
jgi:hypothetical protein